MSTTLVSLLPDLLGRVEEASPPQGPVFWDLTSEVYVQMVDAMFEAAIMTGVVQANNVVITIPPGFTFFPLQVGLGYGAGGYGQGGYGGSIGIPPGAIAAIRMKGAYQIRKTTLTALDNYLPAWQQAAPSAQILAWFPLGTSMFGIYPQASAEITVTMDFIVSPVNKYRPYNGTETAPLQAEYVDMISEYAAAMLRTKEGGAEAEEADVVFQDFMDNMKALSAWQTRIDSLVYSSAFGGKSAVNPRKVG